MKKPSAKEWYNLRPILGYANWAMMYFLLGARCAGKSYALMQYCIEYYKKTHCPFYWIRLSDTQAKNLLKDNALTLVDPDLRPLYDLDLDVTGNIVYNKIGKKKEPFCYVFSANNFYNMKGNGFYNKNYLDDPKHQYIIVCDEFEREQSEKRTISPCIALANCLENIVRMEKDRLKIFFVGNNVEECSELLSGMDFIPETFGTFKLVKNKKKLMEYIKKRNALRFAHKSMIPVDLEYKDIDFGNRVVIENIEPTEKYKAMRASTPAGILLGPGNSSLTNERQIDRSLVVYHQRLHQPMNIIKFTKDKSHWYTIWDGNIIARYKGEHKPVLAMRRYIDSFFNADIQKMVIDLFDTRSYFFVNTITFVRFQADLESIKPQI